jgi:hypothetical protein
LIEAHAVSIVLAWVAVLSVHVLVWISCCFSLATVAIAWE